MDRSVLRFDLYFYTTGQVQFTQRINRTGRRSVDIQQTLVRAKLELLTALLVHVRPAQHRVSPNAGRQRDRSRHLRTRLLRRANDVGRCLIDHGMVERLETDSDSASHWELSKKGSRGRRGRRGDQGVR